MNESHAGIIRSYFGDDFIGTYADVGAYDGITQNITLGLEELGWQGICVEPSLHYNELVKNRKATCVQALCGEHNGYLPYTYYRNVPQFSGINPNPDKVLFAHEYHSQRFVSEIHNVNVYRLDHLLKQVKYDLVKIDVEGYELEVLKGMGEFRPTMLIVENNDGRYSDSVKLLLTDMGYEQYEVLDWDSFYVRILA